MTLAAATPSLAVIGAGPAGLACARVLNDAGLAPQVFEKSRGLGGRLATRRVDGGLQFDHGAQYATARGAAFRAYLAQAEAAGHCAVWTPRLASGPAQEPWYVGVPGMNGLVKPLSDGLDVHLQTEIASIKREAGAFRLTAADGAVHGPFDFVISTAPAPQAARLAADLDIDLGAGRLAPCRALMIALQTPSPAPFDAVRAPDAVVGWAARNTSKPGRPAAPECWIVHAAPTWSEAHLEEPPTAVIERLTPHVLERLATPASNIAYAAAHRWRFALADYVDCPLFVRDASGAFYAGGDWRAGPRVEAAFDSGRAIAADILAQLR